MGKLVEVSIIVLFASLALTSLCGISARPLVETTVPEPQQLPLTFLSWARSGPSGTADDIQQQQAENLVNRGRVLADCADVSQLCIFATAPNCAPGVLLGGREIGTELCPVTCGKCGAAAPQVADTTPPAPSEPAAAADTNPPAPSEPADTPMPEWVGAPGPDMDLIEGPMPEWEGAPGPDMDFIEAPMPEWTGPDALPGDTTTTDPFPDTTTTNAFPDGTTDLLPAQEPPPAPPAQDTTPANPRPLVTQSTGGGGAGAGGAYQQQLLALVNQGRADNGKPPLCLNAKLSAAAAAHNQDMVTQGYFDHVSPQGEGPGERFKKAGYTARGWAENIAMGQRSVEEVYQAWKESPGHWANILSDNTMMGIDKLEAPSGRDYWTQTFATSDVDTCDP